MPCFHKLPERLPCTHQLYFQEAAPSIALNTGSDEMKYNIFLVVLNVYWEQNFRRIFFFVIEVCSR